MINWQICFFSLNYRLVTHLRLRNVTCAGKLQANGTVDIASLRRTAISSITFLPHLMHPVLFNRHCSHTHKSSKLLSGRFVLFWQTNERRGGTEQSLLIYLVNYWCNDKCKSIHKNSISSMARLSNKCFLIKFAVRDASRYTAFHASKSVASKSSCEDRYPKTMSSVQREMSQRGWIVLSSRCSAVAVTIFREHWTIIIWCR